jgi:hypothetical protein
MIDLTTAVFPEPKLPVIEVAVTTDSTDKLPVPLIPTTLTTHAVVDEAVVTEVIAVFGKISPVAYIALRNPVVGGNAPPNVLTVIDDVPVLITCAILPVPKLADLSTAESIELAGKSIADVNPVMVKLQGPATGALNVGIVGGAGTPTNVCVVPVAVNV